MLVEVLLHRDLEHPDVLAGISAAVSVGSLNADVVAAEARKAAPQRGIRPLPVQATRDDRRSPASPNAAWPSCLVMTGRCRRWTPTTSYSERPAS